RSRQSDFRSNLNGISSTPTPWGSSAGLHADAAAEVAETVVEGRSALKRAFANEISTSPPYRPRLPHFMRCICHHAAFCTDHLVRGKHVHGPASSAAVHCGGR